MNNFTNCQVVSQRTFTTIIRSKMSDLPNEYSLDQFEAAEWQRYLQGNIMYNFFNANIDILKTFSLMPYHCYFFISLTALNHFYRPSIYSKH